MIPLIFLILAMYAFQLTLVTGILLLENRPFVNKKEYLIAHIPFFILLPILIYKKFKTLPR